MSELTTAEPQSLDWQEVRRGFVAILPLWLGGIPFAMAFALLARTGGLSLLETCLMSMIVTAGAAQLAMLTIFEQHGGAIGLLGTVLLLNLRHVLYGLSLNQVFPARLQPNKFILAHFITDETYGVAIKDYRDGRGSPAFFFGAGVSLFSSFIAATVAGALLSSLIPDPRKLGLDFVFPLTFLALLLPLVRNRIELVVAIIGGIVAILLSRVTNGGLTILGSTVAAAGIGAGWRLRLERAS